MRIFDCFLFNSELDLLEARLDLLSPVIDRFVLVEATTAHSGVPKPLYFNDNKARFSAYVNKIEHIIVNDLPIPDRRPGSRWLAENAQRRAILRGLETADPNDIALVCDVDELPDPAVVQGEISMITEPVSLSMDLAYLRANWMSAGDWPMARATPIRFLDDAQNLRLSPVRVSIKDAGCHVTYAVDVTEISRKLHTFAHDEFATPHHTDEMFLEACRRLAVFPLTGEVLVARTYDELSAVQKWLAEKYPSLFDWGKLPAYWQRELFSRYIRHLRSNRLLKLSERNSHIAMTFLDRLLAFGVPPR